MPDASVFDQAVQQYPIIKRAGVTGFVGGAQGDNLLEFWPPGEKGTGDAARPSQLPLDAPGVQIYSDKTTPLDVLGDVTSHYLVNTDPQVKGYYQKFASSLNPKQQQFLQQQYQWSVENEGEKRPFAEWAKTSGIPAYFRGYAFKQWPEEFNEQAYTPEQRAMFDDMMKYLGKEDVISAAAKKNGENKKALSSVKDKD
jgi:hypothetical protein